MARECIFCGGTKLTQEHIWPKWAALRMAHVGVVQHRSFAHEEGLTPVENEYPQKAYQQTARVACESCNNDWMSQLENAAKPYFETMLSGKGRAIHQHAQRTLAAWALKTTMVFVASKAKSKTAIPVADHTYLREHGEPSGDVHVLMVSYDGSNPGVCDSYGLEATLATDGSLRTIWGANTTFGTVGFHLFGSNVPRLFLPAEIKVPWVHQIWPVANDFIWTPRPCCNSLQLRAMIDGSLHQYSQATGMDIRIL